MICLLLLPKTLNLSHFPSDWRNLLWRLALVWHVALNTSKSLFMIDASTRRVRSRWVPLFLYLTMAGLLHTMPESDEEVQRLVEEVFGFKRLHFFLQGLAFGVSASSDAVNACHLHHL